MRRRVTALISVGCLACLGVSFVGCIGDDTNAPLPDAGASGDATLSGDGSSAGDGATDASSDDGASCTPVDAGAFSDAEVQAGYALVVAHKCQTCHGQSLQGNYSGVMSMTAEGGLAYPPDLTPDPNVGLGCWTNAQIERAFLHGIDNEGELLCNPMPKFGELGDAGLDQAQADAVLAYLRSIPIVVTNVPDTPQCPVPPPEDAGMTEDAGVDSGVDSGADSGVDAGEDATADSGVDSGADAAPDAAPDGEADASVDAADAGVDSGALEDAALDAGEDAG